MAKGKTPPSKPVKSARKAVSKKSTAKAVKKTDKRGTPKGKGTVSRNGGRIGNPPYDPTPENCIRVEAMVAAGAEQWFIAEELGISKDTLQRHHRPQLDHGLHRALSKIGASMIKRALDGDQDAAKFVLPRRCAEWRTTTQLAGPNGGPIEYRNFTDEEIDARIAALTGGHVSPRRAGK